MSFFRPLLPIFSLLTVIIVWIDGAIAQTADLAPNRFDAAVKRGLDWLAANQNSDGSFGTAVDFFGRDPAVTSLAGLAFLASGAEPGRGDFGENIDRALDSVLASAVRKKGENDDSPPVGLIFNPAVRGKKPMYSHGFSTLFLAECYGRSHRPELKETIRAAVDLIVGSQNGEGGWRYEPYPVEVADISVTTCELAALRAAKNAGFFVPNETVERALDFIRRCQNRNGGFRYLLVDGPSGWSRTGAALAALTAGGLYSGETLDRGLDFLFQKETGDPEYFCYGLFYAALAVRTLDRDAERVEGRPEWFDENRTILLTRQREDGSWPGSISTGADTALALLVLLMDREKIPMFIR